MNIKLFRKQISDLLLKLNNVDKLMTDKVNDYILIEELPLSVPIGNKTIFVGNFTLENNYKFFQSYGKLMSQLGLKYVNFEHLGEGKELYLLCNANKEWYQGIMKIIKKTILKQQAYYLNQFKDRVELKWKNCSWRYFKKNICVETLMQIILLIFTYNFDAEKKNWQILLEKVGTNGHMETYMYNWLRNLPGLTGEFQRVLYQKPASLDKEYRKLKEGTPTKKLKKDKV